MVRIARATTLESQVLYHQCCTWLWRSLKSPETQTKHTIKGKLHFGTNSQILMEYHMELIHFWFVFGFIRQHEYLWKQFLDT